MPFKNVQALIALASIIGALFIARIVMKIHRGEMPGGDVWILYLRILLGFLFAAAITFGFRSFMP
jgi:hypothetical protein